MAKGEPTMTYYDSDGKEVAEGDATATRQYLSDDPARPQSKAETPADQADKALTAPPAIKARTSAPVTK